MTLSEAFTKRLRQYLKEKNITVYEFAKNNGFKQNALSDMLFNKDNSIALENVCKVAKALNINIKDFFDCEDFNLENLDF